MRTAAGFMTERMTMADEMVRMDTGDVVMPMDERIRIVNTMHAIAMRTAEASVLAFLEVGRELCEIKAQLKEEGRNGRRSTFRWIPWVEKNLDFGPTQASVYMRVYRDRAKIMTDDHDFCTVTSAREFLQLQGRTEDDDADEEGDDEQLFSGIEEGEDWEDEDIPDVTDNVTDNVPDNVTDTGADEGVTGATARDGQPAADVPIEGPPDSGPVASEKGRKQLLDGLHPFDRYFSLVKESGGITTLLRTWPREDRETYCEIVRRFGDNFHAIARAIEEMT